MKPVVLLVSNLIPHPLSHFPCSDGRRNKGTVLRLSVNYIVDLRQAVSHSVGLRQEINVARNLVPLLVNQIQVESTLHRCIVLCTLRGRNPVSRSVLSLDA